MNRIHYTVYIHTVELVAAILVMARAFLSHLSSLSYYSLYDNIILLKCYTNLTYCMFITYSRVCINRVRFSILLVVSST